MQIKPEQTIKGRIDGACPESFIREELIKAVELAKSNPDKVALNISVKCQCVINPDETIEVEAGAESAITLKSKTERIGETIDLRQATLNM